MIRPSGANFKQDYARYVSRALNIIHADEVEKNILQLLTGDDPVTRVGKAAVMVMQRLDVAARQSGIEVQDSVKAFAANEIVGAIIKLGEAAKKFKLTKELGELALSLTMQEYINGEVAAGRINRQKLSVKMQADMRQMPPKLRKEMQDSMARIQQTARKYNHGKGMAAQQPAAKGGLING